MYLIEAIVAAKIRWRLAVASRTKWYPANSLATTTEITFHLDTLESLLPDPSRPLLLFQLAGDRLTALSTPARHILTGLCAYTR